MWCKLGPISQTELLHALDPKSAKYSQILSVFLRFCDLYTQKAAHKTFVKLNLSCCFLWKWLTATGWFTIAFLEYCRGCTLAEANILAAEIANHFANVLTFPFNRNKKLLSKAYLNNASHFLLILDPCPPPCEN